MASNSFGHCFRLTTFGESHGPAIGGIVDGCPPGLPLSEADIQKDLHRRKTGTSRYTSQRKEADAVQILSGVFEGVTTGTSIGLLIHNTDAKSKDYADIKEVFRPGHGDYTYFKKYKIRDFRGGGRASARETALRVAAGAIARKWLSQHFGIQIQGYLDQVGPLKVNPEHFSWQAIGENPFFCPDPQMAKALEGYIQDLRKQGDSIGAKVCIQAQGVPCGLGEPIYRKIDMDLACALMSINAVKGVEIGDGYQVVSQKGSEHRDEMVPEGFLSNHSGGVLAGITTGQDLLATMALKPTSSILKPGRSIDIHGRAVEVSTKGRHDPCVGIRAVPVGEAMMALVLMDHALMAQNIRLTTKCV